jgi:hypothetical protein
MSVESVECDLCVCVMDTCDALYIPAIASSKRTHSLFNTNAAAINLTIGHMENVGKLLQVLQHACNTIYPLYIILCHFFTII